MSESSQEEELAEAITPHPDPTLDDEADILIRNTLVRAVATPPLINGVPDEDFRREAAVALRDLDRARGRHLGRTARRAAREASHPLRQISTSIGRPTTNYGRWTSTWLRFALKLRFATEITRLNYEEAQEHDQQPGINDMVVARDRALAASRNRRMNSAIDDVTLPQHTQPRDSSQGDQPRKTSPCCLRRNPAHHKQSPLSDGRNPLTKRLKGNHSPAIAIGTTSQGHL